VGQFSFTAKVDVRDDGREEVIMNFLPMCKWKCYVCRGDTREPSGAYRHTSLRGCSTVEQVLPDGFSAPAAIAGHLWMWLGHSSWSRPSRGARGQVATEAVKGTQTL